MRMISSWFMWSLTWFYDVKDITMPGDRKR